MSEAKKQTQPQQTNSQQLQTQSAANNNNKLITTDQIADNAVTNSKIQDGAVTTSKVADNTVTTNKLADNSVTSSKIQDGTITKDDIKPGEIIGAQQQLNIQKVVAHGTLPACTGGVACPVINEVVATCPDGTNVMSGGYQVSSQINVIASAANTANGWVIRGANPSSSDSGTLDGFAYCLSLSSP